MVFWTDNGTALQALANNVQLEFSYLIPSDIVSDSGIYNWSVVESVLTRAENRGHQCILRFRDTYPGVTSPSVPLYIRSQSGYRTQLMPVENKRTYIPDWSSVSYQNFLLEFFEKFAQKYDQDPRLAYLQVGFGSYAEYHLYKGPFAAGRTFPTKSYQETFLSHIHAKFIKTPWSISIDAADKTTTPFVSNPSLKKLSFGLFDDSFMHQQHSSTDAEYNRASWLFFGKDRFLKSPSGGEFSYYTKYDQQHALDLPDGPHGRSFESFAAQYHITYMIGNDQYEFQSANRITQASMATGYKLKVTSYKTNGLVTEVKIKNTGIAPLYHDVYPCLGNVSSSTSLKGLYGNEERTCIIPLVASDSLKLQMCAPKLLPSQQIQFEADL
jgi:hypothetical protein